MGNVVEVYSVATLAEHWQCGTDTVYALIHSGQVRAFKLGGKLWRIRADEVERFEQLLPATPAPARISDSAAMRLERMIG